MSDDSTSRTNSYFRKRETSEARRLHLHYRSDRGVSYSFHSYKIRKHIQYPSEVLLVCQITLCVSWQYKITCQNRFSKVIWHTFGLADFYTDEQDRCFYLNAPVLYFLFLGNGKVTTDHKGRNYLYLGGEIRFLLSCFVKKESSCCLTLNFPILYNGKLGILLCSIPLCTTLTQRLLL